MMNHRGTETPRDLLTERVIGAAIEVHKQLGPGLLESAYQICLCHELKTVERIQPVHEAQLLTYMKLANIGKGLLLNLHAPILKQGIKRMVL